MFFFLLRRLLRWKTLSLYTTALPQQSAVLRDAKDSAALKVHVKQARPVNLQEAVVSKLEFESIVQSSQGETATSGKTGSRARKVSVQVLEMIVNRVQDGAAIFQV